MLSKKKVKKKFNCFEWMLEWLKHYDELNKTDIGKKIYEWILKQPMQKEE